MKLILKGNLQAERLGGADLPKPRSPHLGQNGWAGKDGATEGLKSTANVLPVLGLHVLRHMPDVGIRLYGWQHQTHNQAGLAGPPRRGRPEVDKSLI